MSDGVVWLVILGVAAYCVWRVRAERVRSAPRGISAQVSFDQVEAEATQQAAHRRACEFALQSQLDAASLAHLSVFDQQDMVKLAISGPRGKVTREHFEAVFPPGRINWAPPYLAYLARRKEGRRVRLTDHQIMLEGLIRKLGKLYYARLNSDVSDLSARHNPHVIFRVLQDDVPAYCASFNGMVWASQGADFAFQVVQTCPLPDCTCQAHLCSDALLNMRRAEGKRVEFFTRP